MLTQSLDELIRSVEQRAILVREAANILIDAANADDHLIGRVIGLGQYAHTQAYPPQQLQPEPPPQQTYREPPVVQQPPDAPPRRKFAWPPQTAVESPYQEAPYQEAPVRQSEFRDVMQATKDAHDRNLPLNGSPPPVPQRRVVGG